MPVSDKAIESPLEIARAISYTINIRPSVSARVWFASRGAASSLPRTRRPFANSALSALESFVGEERPAPDKMAGKVDKTKKLEPVPKPDEKLYRDRIQAETAAIDELKTKIVRREPFS